MLDDMHDGTVAQGDAWLSKNVAALLSSPAFTTQHSLLFITWDENDDSPGNQVPAARAARGRGPDLQAITLCPCPGLLTRPRPRGCGRPVT
jgi:Phosphoesterase family